MHADDVLCCLVAHHTCAIVEADERGLAATLAAEFTRPRPDLDEALIYCDMTGGPAVQSVAGYPGLDVLGAEITNAIRVTEHVAAPRGELEELYSVVPQHLRPIPNSAQERLTPVDEVGADSTRKQCSH